MKDKSNGMRRCIQICLLLICATPTILRAQSPSSSDRVESIVGKMSLEEKIDYIGGTGFAILVPVSPGPKGTQRVRQDQSQARRNTAREGRTECAFIRFLGYRCWCLAGAGGYVQGVGRTIIGGD
jgi:hypothetical protein